MAHRETFQLRLHPDAIEGRDRALRSCPRRDARHDHTEAHWRSPAAGRTELVSEIRLAVKVPSAADRRVVSKIF